MKVDSNLNVQWHQWQGMIFGAWKIRPDPLGGYVAVGNGGTNKPYAVERLDSAGNQVWYQTHGTMAPNGNNSHYAADVVVCADSNYLVGCIYGNEIQLMKISRLTGDSLWTRQYQGMAEDGIMSMDYAGNDTYICAGYKLFLIDTAGNKLWNRNFSPSNYFPRTVHVAKTLDGGFALAGSFENISGIKHRIIFMIKTDSLGNSVWSSIYNMEGVPLTIYPNPASDYIYISTGTFAGARNLTFTLYDMQGTIKMQEHYNGSSVNISHIPQGMYIAAVSSGQKTIRARVVVRR